MFFSRISHGSYIIKNNIYKLFRSVLCFRSLCTASHVSHKTGMGEKAVNNKAQGVCVCGGGSARL